jgi:prophage DNA circulation protein
VSWRDQLRPASFRGVPFFVETSSARFGREGVIHEYAQRDTPAVEDMGRKSRPFSVSGFIVGDNYLAERDRLIQAAELPGPGILIHPTYGRLRVFCLELSVDEGVGERGAALVALSLVEAGDLQFPTATVTGDGRKRSGAENLKAETVVDFVSAFDTSGAAFQLSQAIEQAGQQLDELREAIEAPEAVVDDGFSVLGDLEQLSADLVSLVQTPQSLADRVVALFESVADFGAAFTYLRRAPTTVRTLSGSGTSTEQQAEDNADALAALFNRLALVLVAQELDVATFTAREDAEQFLADFSGYCEAEELREVATSDRTYQAIVDARTGVAQTVSDAAIGLPSLVDVSAADGFPAVVLSYQLYGDAERDEEIADRNGALDPLFMAGALKVLSR